MARHLAGCQVIPTRVFPNRTSYVRAHDGPTRNTTLPPPHRTVRPNEGSAGKPTVCPKKVCRHPRRKTSRRHPPWGSGQRGEAQARAAAEEAKAHTCACGCGGRIRVTSRQFRAGVLTRLRESTREAQQTQWQSRARKPRFQSGADVYPSTTLRLSKSAADGVFGSHVSMGKIAGIFWEAQRESKIGWVSPGNEGMGP